jgi:hypothetical protein
MLEQDALLARNLRQEQANLAAAISLHEGLIGQVRLGDVNKYLLEQDTGVVSEFYKIINAFEESKALFDDADKKYQNDELANEEYDKASNLYNAAIKNFNESLKSFFTEHGANFDENGISVPSEYENDANKQAIIYFLIYLHVNYNLENGEIQRKNTGSDEKDTFALLELLESSGFSSAYTIRASLESTDPDEVPKILPKGAVLGNMDCRFKLVERYLGHMAGSASQANPDPYVFPEGVNEDMILEWANEIRSAGHVNGLANMQNYMGNVFGAIGAMYQEGANQVTDQQKSHLKKMAEIVKKISGDEVINQHIDGMVKLEFTEIQPKMKVAEYNIIRNKANIHLLQEYGPAVKQTNKQIDEGLSPLFKTNLEKVQKSMLELKGIINTRAGELQAKLDGDSSNPKEIAMTDTVLMLNTNLAQIDKSLISLEATLGKEPIPGAEYHNCCLESALAVNKLRIEVYHQPHPKSWVQGINNMVNSILQTVRPREHKPYALFLAHEQKVARDAVKIAKDGLKKTLEGGKEPSLILTQYMKATKAEAVDKVKGKIKDKKEEAKQAAKATAKEAKKAKKQPRG